MPIKKLLLRFARAVVDMVIRQVTQQIEQVQNTVMNGISQMVQRVVGGIWRGKGATAFVQEMQSEVLPAFGQLVGVMRGTTTSINRAAEIMGAADSNGSSKVGPLVDAFRAIYAG